MFEPLPELASDLEWMLESGQVTRETLAEALVHEHYPTVYRLARAILDDTPAARWAARETFAIALLEVYRYRGDQGIQAWLYGIALDTCHAAFKSVQRRRTFKATFPVFSKPSDFGDSLPETELDAAAWLAIDAMPEQERLALLMHFALDWSDAQIAATLKMSPADAAALVDRLRQNLLTTIWLPFRLAHTENQPHWLDNLDQFLQHSLQRRWPAPEFPPTDLEKLVHQALGRSRLKNTRRRLQSMAKELALVGATILVVVGAVWGGNRLWPEPAPQPPATVLVTRLVEAIEDPTALTPTSAPGSQEALHIVVAGDTLSKLAKKWGVSIIELRNFNRLSLSDEIQPGQILVNPARLSTISTRIATSLPPAIPTPTIDAATDWNLILEHLAKPPGQGVFTAWINAQVIDYGPPGYIGPARLDRLQTWISPDQLLVLSGSYEKLQEVWLQTDGAIYQAQPGAEQPQFVLTAQTPELRQFLIQKLPLGEILGTHNQSIFAFSRLEVTKIEQQAGRTSLVVDGYTPGNLLSTRFWVDRSSGLVLRKQVFGLDGATLLREINVTSILYNIDFPQSLFAPAWPWRGGYARDQSGDPIQASVSSPFSLPGRPELDYDNPPPLFFDISSSTLSLQFSRTISLWDKMMPAELFADGYHLGAAYFGDPWTTICDRSPDGLKLAFVSQSYAPEDTYVYWFSLDQPSGQLQNYFDDKHPRQIAYAPDSQRLAVFGQYDADRQIGELYILDTADKSVQVITQLSAANSLVWSPDGKFLAFIARFEASDTEDFVVVIDVETGETTYTASVDYESNATPDWPMLTWGVEFPVEAQGLEQCRLPFLP